ncbi:MULTISPECIES: hypothetical protein [Mesorhizobium]|uniref:hypothetical protein n=1 Tax=Mesorhizobium TaxID=68287 RepID=UPI001FD62CC9|nr:MULTISPECIES: hypothetical protein [Mesorhizobium]
MKIEVVVDVKTTLGGPALGRRTGAPLLDDSFDGRVFRATPDGREFAAGTWR